MNLVGESMRNFRNKLMNEPPPKTVNLLINLIILRKGIKRDKSGERNELFDGKEMDQSEDVSDKNDEEDLLLQNVSQLKRQSNSQIRKATSSPEILFYL